MTPKLTLTTDPCVLGPTLRTTLADGVDAAAVPPQAAARGQVPPIALALFCIASALLGVVIDHRFLQVAAPAPKIALAEQGAVVLEALLNQPDLDATSARRLVGESVAAVVRKYQSEGYLVVNETHGSDGQLVIEAVPASAIDITEEMRSAVARSVSRSAAAPNSPAGSAPAKAQAGRVQTN